MSSNDLSTPKTEENTSAGHSTSSKSAQGTQRKRKLVFDDDFFCLGGSFLQKKKAGVPHPKSTTALNHQPSNSPEYTSKRDPNNFRKLELNQSKDSHQNKSNDNQVVLKSDSVDEIEEIITKVEPTKTEKVSHELQQEKSHLPLFQKLHQHQHQHQQHQRQRQLLLPLRVSSFDKELLKREIELKLDAVKDTKEKTLLEDSDEEYYEPTKTSSTSLLRSETPPLHTDLYDFDMTSERKRKYIIRVSSKLPVPEGLTVQVDLGCKGLKSFDKILQSAVDFFRKTYARQLPPILLQRYNYEESALVWVEGKTLIHSFFTPRTLRIPLPGGLFNPALEKIEDVPPTMMLVFLIPKESSTNFLQVYPEFTTPTDNFIMNETAAEEQVVEAEEEDLSSEEDDVLQDVLESQNTATNVNTNPSSNLNLNSNSNSSSNSNSNIADDGVFAIGLKGKDNKRIMCNVTPATKLQNILLFYLNSKGLDPKGPAALRAKLIFDDEELDLKLSVRDTELEEDFEIQVVV